MKKLLFYLIFTVVNLILIILDILRPFLGLVRILAYCNLLGLAFCYFIYDKLPSAFIIGTILSFSIWLSISDRFFYRCQNRYVRYCKL